MDFRKFGLLAACLALPVSALDNGSRGAPARETSQAELVDKSSTGVSPVPTSRPELVQMELFRRDSSYSLPSDYCGWYADYKSASYTCGLISASCINIGSYRGCCSGQTTNCASTFFSSCIPSSKLAAAQTCGKGTICCSATNYPECGTILFSSSADPDTTFTNIDCWSAGMGTTYRMQDYPPFTSTTSDSTTTTPTTSPSPASASTTTPAVSTQTSDPGPSTPIGPIVGGVVGGVAVIGLIVLGIFFIMRRRRPDNAAAQQQPPQAGAYPPPMGQVHTGSPPPPTNSPGGMGVGVPPAFDPRYSYAQPPPQASPYQVAAPVHDPNKGFYAPGYPNTLASPDVSKMSTSPHPSMVTASPHPTMAPSTSPVHYQQHGEHVNEAPATNPVGIGNNRAELA